MFNHIVRYCIIAFAATGWGPNAAAYSIADNPLGPWAAIGNPCVGTGVSTTFDSQGTRIVHVAGRPGAFILMASRRKNNEF